MFQTHITSFAIAHYHNINIRVRASEVSEKNYGLFTKLDHFMHLITKLDQKTGANATHFTKLDQFLQNWIIRLQNWIISGH